MMTMLNLMAIELNLRNEDILTFSVEMSIFLGFVIISILLIVLRGKFPQVTRNGWIELVIGAPAIALKGLFDGLDTVTSGVAKDVFDSLEASFLFLGLILLGIGLLRIALFSAKTWEVR